ncbi:KCNK9 [Lepeophtheirus salmonis]|uniref:KCNK9 n=1 Tax=Lepeophtheirus salmonis TaxID=72036 RepID=A0A7R8CLU6_LEPSM|nr:KCNK9 [Lepeophtheirus salmonis]CAF2861013.1 KCNK9 [Lepeophtheirus salmonis]
MTQSRIEEDNDRSMQYTQRLTYVGHTANCDLLLLRNSYNDRIGDLVALQQDNALETKPEYVTFASLFIMFGLASIAASLNLMVLKSMMLNTEDEKRDEQEAIQAAAHTVRLDGDVILQQNDVIHWQAQEMDIDEEVRSVCSCNGCYPLHRLVYSSHQRPGGVQSGNEIWAPTIPAIRRQLSVSAIEEHLRPMSKKKPSSESVHDLRRSTMCSMLRLPSASPLLVDSRILKCPSCDARIVQELLANHKIEASYEERRRSFELSLSPWDDDRISTGSDLNIFSRLWRTISQGGTMVEDTFSQPSPVNNRRYSFVLDEIESLKTRSEGKKICITTRGCPYRSNRDLEPSHMSIKSTYDNVSPNWFSKGSPLNSTLGNQTLLKNETQNNESNYESFIQLGNQSTLITSVNDTAMPINDSQIIGSIFKPYYNHFNGHDSNITCEH